MLVTHFGPHSGPYAGRPIQRYHESASKCKPLTGKDPGSPLTLTHGFSGTLARGGGEGTGDAVSLASCSTGNSSLKTEH